MNAEDKYRAWKDRRREIRIADGFADRVMDQVLQHQRGRPPQRRDSQRLLEFVSARPVVKAALVAAGAAVGLLRMALMIHMVLG